VRKSFSGKPVNVYFDGGKDCIGVVGCDIEGEIVFVYGHHSELYNTNNVAELCAA
jgi:hypothetical protein